MVIGLYLYVLLSETASICGSYLEEEDMIMDVLVLGVVHAKSSIHLADFCKEFSGALSGAMETLPHVAAF